MIIPIEILRKYTKYFFYIFQVFPLEILFDAPSGDILADSSPAVPERQGRRKEEVRDKGKQREEGNKDAATALPDDEEWGVFDVLLIYR